MIDYENAKVQSMIADAMEAMMAGGNLVGIDFKVARIVGLDNPMPFSKVEDIARLLLTDVFGAAGLAIVAVVTPTSAGRFICEVEGLDGEGIMTTEHDTPALAVLAALVFSMAEAIGAMA